MTGLCEDSLPPSGIVSVSEECMYLIFGGVDDDAHDLTDFDSNIRLERVKWVY